MQKNTALNGKLPNWFRRFFWVPSKRIFAPVALLCIAYIVWLSWFDIVTLWAASNGAFLVLACFFLAVAHFLLPVASREIFYLAGVHVDYRVLLRIHICRLPARYLPGGIWHTVGRAVDLDGYGVPRPAIAWLVAFENGLAVSTAFSLGGALLLFSGEQAISYSWLVALAAASGLLMLVVAPLFIRTLWPHAVPDMNPAIWTKCCVWFFLVWTSQAAAFVAYSHALVGGNVPAHMFHTAGVYLFSWAIGFLAFFAPQGIGVFEATVALLSGKIMFPAAIAMVAGFRLCMLVVDLCLGLGGRFLRTQSHLVH